MKSAPEIFDYTAEDSDRFFFLLSAPQKSRRGAGNSYGSALDTQNHFAKIFL